MHIVKLCVGVDSVDELEYWINLRQAEKRAKNLEPVQIHTTRMTPRRKEELLSGGSLYWVIKGLVQARQPLLDLRLVVGEDGISRCQIVMSPELIRTQTHPKRAFQGWRYLKPGDAPDDLAQLSGIDDLPPAFLQELADLGLL